MNENQGAYGNLENTSFWECFQRTSDIGLWPQAFFILVHYSENSSFKEDLNDQKNVGMLYALPFQQDLRRWQFWRDDLSTKRKDSLQAK